MNIETKTAAIDTFSVTIQALHVNGKQMTLSVFRQLPQCDYDNKLTVWGHVRYSIKDEGDLWAVVEKNAMLFRVFVPANQDRAISYLEEEIAKGMNIVLHKKYGYCSSLDWKMATDEETVSKLLVKLNERLELAYWARSAREVLLSKTQLFIAV